LLTATIPSSEIVDDFGAAIYIGLSSRLLLPLRGGRFAAPSPRRLVSRSKSLSKRRSCTMRYFSNSLSAWARAISAVTLPAFLSPTARRPHGSLSVEQRHLAAHGQCAQLGVVLTYTDTNLASVETYIVLSGSCN